jgi:branched-chain amino acid transport system ATP-binding protein
MTTILDVQTVSKTFGGLRAVHEVSLDLNNGEILGIIGPNGAGKTTLFNMISGCDSSRQRVGDVRWATNREDETS